MNDIYKYGFTDFFIAQITSKDLSKIAKVVSVMKREYKVIVNDLVYIAVIKGSSLHYNKESDSDLPKVGDFVLLTKTPDVDTRKLYIEKILNRKNVLKRKLAGKNNAEQIIASNIDVVFITVSCDEQFNLNKIERIYIAAKDAGNMDLVVVLTKSDLVEDSNVYVSQISSKFPDVQVVITSNKDSSSINPLLDILKPNKIAVFIGSSGAGKSTLSNMIMSSKVQKTSEVSSEDNQGRHTTTHRELFLLETGGCIIDTPGIREFGLFIDNDKTLDLMFSDIIQLSLNCKFSNCSHINEIGCAVLQAIQSNNLTIARLEHYKKLKKEVDDLSFSRKKSNQSNFKKKKILNKQNNKNFKIEDYF